MHKMHYGTCSSSTQQLWNGPGIPWETQTEWLQVRPGTSFPLPSPFPLSFPRPAWPCRLLPSASPACLLLCPQAEILTGISAGAGRGLGRHLGRAAGERGDKRHSALLAPASRKASHSPPPPLLSGSLSGKRLAVCAARKEALHKLWVRPVRPKSPLHSRKHSSWSISPKPADQVSPGEERKSLEWSLVVCLFSYKTDMLPIQSPAGWSQSQKQT